MDNCKIHGEIKKVFMKKFTEEEIQKMSELRTIEPEPSFSGKQSRRERREKERKKNKSRFKNK